MAWTYVVQFQEEFGASVAKQMSYMDLCVLLHYIINE